VIPWELQGREFINCNCSHACPCQFNSPPSFGFCEAVGSFAIDEGHYGEVSLDGLRFGMLARWPGAIHEGRGICQPILDARADDAQRNGLLRILTGQDTDPFATLFAVFSTTFEKVLDPIVAPIEFDVDIDARRGHVRVPGVFETVGEPIRNPVTGAEHRVRIDLPNGFEYEIAEIGSGSSRTQGALVMDLQGTYGQFARLHLDNHGVVRHRAIA